MWSIYLKNVESILYKMVILYLNDFAGKDSYQQLETLITWSIFYKIKTQSSVLTEILTNIQKVNILHFVFLIFRNLL